MQWDTPVLLWMILTEVIISIYIHQEANNENVKTIYEIY